MKEVKNKLDRRRGSSEQDLYADGERCWKAVELGRYRREVDSINSLQHMRYRCLSSAQDLFEVSELQ